jgi:chromate transporter
MFQQLLALFLIFAKIGLFTFGGGLAMIPLIQQELVTGSFMTLRETIDMVAIAQMTPGPFAVNSATFAGMRLYGVPGAAAATLGVTLPSFVICLIVAKRFFGVIAAPPVKSLLAGIRPVVYALILSGAVSICGTAVFPSGFGLPPDVPVLAIAVTVSVLMWKTKLSPVLLVLSCGIFGAVFLR